MIIKHIRLINGEELLGYLMNETPTELVLSQPLLVEELENEMGIARKVLTNYIRFATGDIECKISKAHVITYNDVHPEVKKYYENSLTFAKDYDEEFLLSLKSANDKMHEYITSEQIPYMDETESNDDFELVNSPFFHQASNTSH